MKIFFVMPDFNEILLKWSSEENGNDYIAINKLLQYLGENLYYDYEPTSGPYPEYYSRLKRWIINLSTEADQKNLLRLAKRIFYIGREEFKSLYRSAYTDHLMRWIMDKENILTFDKLAVDKMSSAVGDSWFCPITDSMRINPFYHVNQIIGSHEFRPDWRSLRKFGDPGKILSYIKDNKIKYLVLLEDFVGSGTQSIKALKFACELDSSLQILFIPLIICKKGLDLIQAGLSDYANFSMSPVLIVEEEGYISKVGQAGEDSILNEFRRIIENSEPEYKTLKYGFLEMGCLIVMYTNTPTNTLPLINYESDNSWSPLFKRHHRNK